ncbi:MAG: hypothetical protein LBV12_04365 [Puniceicoccales bacterium]|jgi:hypothetical protein|nr:hypothetical protein [Puniceicoccales bacterium]
MINQPKFAAVIFSFSDDTDSTIETVRSLQYEIPGLHILIAEDLAAPLTPQQKARFHRFPNISFSTTTHKRNRNLNGYECVRGQLVTMNSFAWRTGAQWIFKIDADAGFYDHRLYTEKATGSIRAVFPSNRRFLPQEKRIKYPDGWGIGLCYALRADGIPDLMEYFKTKQGGGGEDLETSQACRTLWPEDIAWIDHGFAGFLGFDFIRQEHVRPVLDAEKLVKDGAKLVHWGNRYTFPGVYTDKEKRHMCALYARQANDYVESIPRKHPHYENIL